MLQLTGTSAAAAKRLGARVDCSLHMYDWRVLVIRPRPSLARLALRRRPRRNTARFVVLATRIRPRDAKSAFLKWAEECHRELDKVVMYTDKLPAEAQDVAGMTRFGACSVQSEGGGASTRAEGLLRVGDCVKIPKARGRSEVVGKVKSFLVNGNHDHPKCKDGSHHVNGEVEFLPPKSREGVPSPNPVRKKLKDIERATEKEYRAYAKKLVQALPQGLSVTFDPMSGRAHPCPPLSLSVQGARALLRVPAA